MQKVKDQLRKWHAVRGIRVQSVLVQEAMLHMGHHAKHILEIGRPRQVHAVLGS